ncbi:MAG: hypothetical protein M1840_002498 [Geoglossum simile]|nr:MAG: hypothetical protein M1840_002498 [Geoglossum simile]
MASIYASLASLLFEDKYSDLTITCGGRTFRAHRAVVCPQAPFFDKACDGSFKESISQVIDLPDDDPYILERFLQFLYKGTYEDGEYPVLNRPSLSATMTPEEVQEELDQPLGIDTSSVSDGQGEVPETMSRDPTHTPAGRDDARGGGGADHEEEEEEEKEEEYDDDENKDQSEIEYNEFDESGGNDHAANLAGDTEGVLHQTDWPHSLFTSLRVYVMADKFGVRALKLLARERFYRTAERIYVTCEDFPAVVDEMYRSTPPNDIAMREIPCRLVANQYFEEKALKERMDPVMREHGELAVGVINYMFYLRGFGKSFGGIKKLL